MAREDKQLPSPPPEAAQAKYSKSKHVKGSSSGSVTKSLPSTSSSNLSTGQAKRTTFSSSTNGTKKIDTNDDLFIRLLAHKALTESHDRNILNPEEIDE